MGMATPQHGPAPPLAQFGAQGRTTSWPSQGSFLFAQQSHPSQGAPVPAMNYAADCADHIDMMFVSCLGTLDRVTASKLMVRRLVMGRYEIDARPVTVRWGDVGGMPGLLVKEEDVKDSTASEMPLPAYLAQAANVISSLSGARHDMPKISRIPKEQRLTFADAASSKTQELKLDNVGNERCESMRIACEQAMLREQAAEAYERGMLQSFPAIPTRQLPPPPGLPVPYLN